MTEEQKELFFDLLTKKAIYGLTDAEERDLESVDPGNAAEELLTLEMTAAAISLIGSESEEPMPAHLRGLISAAAVDHVGTTAADVTSDSVEPIPSREIVYPQEKAGVGWFGWLGWAAAAAVSVALVINIFRAPQPETEIARQIPQPTTEKPRDPAQLRDEMLSSPHPVITADWAPGNVKDVKNIQGDVVWSDETQEGYMRFRGLPVNDRSKETYQLCIFDKTQDKATPIDGGTFDVTAYGEVVIPIDARLKAQEPALFAVTIEKPGGVVVSKREKIIALAKVETKSS
jgi:hypothetical protein